MWYTAYKLVILYGIKPTLSSEEFGWVYLCPTKSEKPFIRMNSWLFDWHPGPGATPKIHIYIYIWMFPKIVVPNNHGFPTKRDHFWVFWGYHHLRTHPYIDLRFHVKHLSCFSISSSLAEVLRKKHQRPAEENMWIGRPAGIWVFPTIGVFPQNGW